MEIIKDVCENLYIKHKGKLLSWNEVFIDLRSLDKIFKKNDGLCLDEDTEIIKLLRMVIKKAKTKKQIKREK